VGRVCINNPWRKLDDISMAGKEKLSAAELAFESGQSDSKAHFGRSLPAHPARRFRGAHFGCGRDAATGQGTPTSERIFGQEGDELPLHHAGEPSRQAG
jgi:hypothetical protein